VQLSPEQRSALSTIGNAAIGVALGMSVLVVAFIVSQFATGQGSVARPAPSASASVAAAAVVAATVTPTPSPTPPPTSSSSPTAAPAVLLVTASPTATATPTPSPSRTPDALTAEPYSNSGKRYAALRAPVGYTYVAPFAGAVQVRMYQLINGEVRVGSVVPTLPFYPYVTLESSDRRLIFRPGALDVDAQVLIKDGERADSGTPLFKIVGDGASSWRTFYDRGVTANIIASVAALPSGAELDPVAFFTMR
jgi:hypothetical protein